MTKLCIATENMGKFNEFNQMLQNDAWHLTHLGLYDIPQAEETGTTFIENAILKARHASEHLKQPCIADDSGLMIDALKGAPGVHSARYAGVDKDDNANLQKVLTELRDIELGERHATFYCAIAFIRHANDPQPEVFVGRWHGLITQHPQGLEGFGYDPIFFDPQYKKTAAELPMAIKNSISHRAQAMHGLRKFMQSTCE